MAQIALNYYLLEGNGGTVALPFLACLHNRRVRWLVLVLVLVWAGWCWVFFRGKYCWLVE